MTAVMLVENHVRLGQMIGRLLHESENIAVWSLAPTAEIALNELFNIPQGVVWPDVVLVDVALPFMNGVALVAEIQRRYPNLPCLMVSGQIKSETISSALAAGSQGYVSKQDIFALGEAVRQVLSGEVFLSDEVRKVLAKEPVCTLLSLRKDQL